VIALALGSLVRSERVTPGLLGGGALVLAGVGLVLLGKQRARRLPGA